MPKSETLDKRGSRVPSGQNEARMMGEMETAALSSLPSLTVQNVPSRVRQEESVKKSDSATFK